MKKLMIFVAIVAICAAGNAHSQDYKPYTYSRSQSPLFEITFDKELVTITAFMQDTVELACERKSLRVRKDAVYYGDTRLFDNQGLYIDSTFCSYADISDTRIVSRGEQITVTFLTGSSASSRVENLKRGNRWTYGEPIHVPEKTFIRGMVFSVTGDIEVYGEVNRDVVSLFGNVYISPSASVRGDIATVTGRVSASRESTVYGEIYYIDQRGRIQAYRFLRDEEGFRPIGSIEYNRVDGLALKAGVAYEDIDSLLPSFRGMIGYAFESKRWRYEAGVEQVIIRDPALSVGGTVYRDLKSEDDWLLQDAENTVFALFATEDYRDYYEAEGGSLYLRMRPMDHTILETGYRYESTRWLRAHRALWSLFGGDKLFDYNFGSVDETYREQGMREIDTTDNAVWFSSVDYDERIEGEPFARSAWHLSAAFEWSLDGLQSDYDYRRYSIAVRRYQKIYRQSMLLVRGILGNSDRYVPMYKRFFLGGLGTLHGYRQKEFIGTRFWMANAEYRVDIRSSDVALSLLWDVGQIANDTRFNKGTNVLHSIGAAAYVGDDFRLVLSKRLDRGFDDDPKFYIRLDHRF